MSAPINNPVQIENRILDVLNRIAAGIEYRSDAYDEWDLADDAYDKAFAIAYESFAGPAHHAKYYATVETAELRHARTLADMKYKRAERHAKALENELSALQSLLKSILAAYGAAGVGERY